MKLTQWQAREAIGLASKAGHAWACLQSTTDDQVVEWLMAGDLEALGDATDAEATPGLPGGILCPTIVDGLTGPNVVHVTGSGRLEWTVMPTGVTCTVSRPTGPVIQAGGDEEDATTGVFVRVLVNGEWIPVCEASPFTAEGRPMARHFAAIPWPIRADQEKAIDAHIRASILAEIADRNEAIRRLSEEAYGLACELHNLGVEEIANEAIRRLQDDFAWLGVGK